MTLPTSYDDGKSTNRRAASGNLVGVVYIALADNLKTIPVLLGGLLVEIALLWFEQGIVRGGEEEGGSWRGRRAIGGGVHGSVTIANGWMLLAAASSAPHGVTVSVFHSGGDLQYERAGEGIYNRRINSRGMA